MRANEFETDECGLALLIGFTPHEHSVPGDAARLWVCTLKPYHTEAHGGASRRARGREIFSVFNDRLWSVGLPK